MAQQVTPVTISLAEFKVDSLRTLYGSEPIMYRASLDAVAQALEKNATELKSAKAELKSEQQLTKEMESSLKGATKMAASMKKLYSKEEGELKSMQKVVTGQQKMLTKQKELNDETREAYTAFLDKQQNGRASTRRIGSGDLDRQLPDEAADLQSGGSPESSRFGKHRG